MKRKELIKRARELAKRYRVADGRKFRLKDVDPADTAGLGDDEKSRAKELLQMGVEVMASLQERLYAQDRWAVLLVFQAMDAAGKDGAIKHVMSGVNPQGCDVHSFKSPSNLELDHDFLWRNHARVPERGHIGIFNRSYYEEVLVVRVHQELLALQKIPPALVTKHIWKERFEDINAFERYLTRNGVIIRKFFLHLSKKEQKRRFMDRLDNPDKNWKFSMADARERGYWTDYMRAYEEMIRHTASEAAPWQVIPADHKWFTRLAVAAAVIEALTSVNLEFPKVDAAKRKELEKARTALANE